MPWVYIRGGICPASPIPCVKSEAVVTPRSTDRGASLSAPGKSFTEGVLSAPRSPKSESLLAGVGESAHKLLAWASTPGTCGCRQQLWRDGGLQGDTVVSRRGLEAEGECGTPIQRNTVLRKTRPHPKDVHESRSLNERERFWPATSVERSWA